MRSECTSPDPPPDGTEAPHPFEPTKTQASREWITPKSSDYMRPPRPMVAREEALRERPSSSTTVRPTITGATKEAAPTTPVTIPTAGSAGAKGTTTQMGSKTVRTTVIRPMVVHPDTGETPEDGAVATQRFLSALAAVDNQAPRVIVPATAPGEETAETYNPPKSSDEGSGPHSSDGAPEEAPTFNAFGAD